MNKLLIISSEELNPGNKLSSTFELSQAQILSSKYDVSIISVTARNSLSATLKQIFKYFLNNKSNDNYSFRSSVKELKSILLFVGFKKKVVKKYIIEGIPVYEGFGFFIKSSSNFYDNLSIWTKAGLSAFDIFCEENGMPDIIHAHGRFLNAGALALAIKKKNKISYIYTEHSTYYQRGLAPVESKFVLSEVINQAFFFTCVSPSLVESVSKFLEQNHSAAFIVPNVIDKIYETSIPIRKSSDGFVFLTVASLDYKKGIDVLLKAFKKAFDGNQKYLLQIAGEGLLRTDLEKLKSDLKLNDTVSFLGSQSKFEIKLLMDSADIFVLPSRIETFGVVVIEALSRGCPVIATKSGGPEYILNESCGVVIEANNENQLVNSLKNMISGYSIYNKKSIHDFAINNYGAEAFLQKMNVLYSQILSQKN